MLQLLAQKYDKSMAVLILFRLMGDAKTQEKQESKLKKWSR